jgi:hypothetical protein
MTGSRGEAEARATPSSSGIVGLGLVVGVVVPRGCRRHRYRGGSGVRLRAPYWPVNHRSDAHLKRRGASRLATLIDDNRKAALRLLALLVRFPRDGHIVRIGLPCHLATAPAQSGRSPGNAPAISCRYDRRDPRLETHVSIVSRLMGCTRVGRVYRYLSFMPISLMKGDGPFSWPL